MSVWAAEAAADPRQRIDDLTIATPGRTGVDMASATFSGALSPHNLPAPFCERFSLKIDVDRDPALPGPHRRVPCAALRITG